MAKKTWSDLSPSQRRAICVAGAVETVMTGAALFDLSRRSPLAVRGPKPAWVIAAFVQPVGPISYFVWGRR